MLGTWPHVGPLLRAGRRQSTAAPEVVVCPSGRCSGRAYCREAGISKTWCNVGIFVCAGRGQFTAALEVVEAERLVMSFLHHMALQRQCRNPFEKGDIAGITNYLDVGLQVLPESEQPARMLPCLDGVLRSPLCGLVDANVSWHPAGCHQPEEEEQG